MIISLIILSILLTYAAYRTVTRFDKFISKIECTKGHLYLINGSARSVSKLLDTPFVKDMGEIDDDPDVYGRKVRVYYKLKVFGLNVSFAVADFYFYYDKQYKNRREYLWHDKEEGLELNFYEKLVTNSMKALLMKPLKRKLQG